MWRAITSCLFACFCCAGCNQEQVPQPELQPTESAQQAFDESAAPGPSRFGGRDGIARAREADEGAAPDPDRFIGRDGIAEARESIAAGNPPKLYMHVFNGYAPGWATPGIAYCQPWSDDVVSFEDIPELAWSEGSAPNPPEPPNARSFAIDFNKTMFEAHERQIKMVCPDAEVI